MTMSWSYEPFDDADVEPAPTEDGVPGRLATVRPEGLDEQAAPSAPKVTISPSTAMAG